MTKRQTKKQNQNSAAVLWRFLRGSKAYFILGVTFAVIGSLFELIIPRITGYTVDSVIGQGDGKISSFAANIINRLGGAEALRDNLFVVALAIATLGLLAALCKYLFRVSNAKGAETLVKNMHNMIFAHIQSLPFSWHMKNRTGDIIQRCTSDTNTVKRFVADQLTTVVRATIRLGLSLAFMISTNAKLSIIPIVIIPIIIGYSTYFHNRIAKHFLTCDENEGILSNIAQENLTGVRVVRAFGRENYEKEKFATQNKKYTGLWIRLLKFLTAYWASGDLVTGLLVMLVLVFGTKMCVAGSMTQGDLIAFISYNAMIIWPVRMLGRVISEMSKAGVSIKRIAYIIESKEEKDPENALTPAMTGDVKFEKVSFGYDEEHELLHEIDLTIKSGTTCGILGTTGSGKSTLVHLLDRLYPLPSGRITVGGMDIAEMKASHLRKNIAVVLQEPFLFSGTIKENIAMGLPDYLAEKEVDRRIEEAIDIACLRETIESFDKGLETFVGERGVTLSGGQKQRLAIARTVVQNAPIMVFDDSLSAVDTETDAKIRNALLKKMKGTTSIIISHRITTLMHADQIVVLDHGRIAESGKHEELLKQNGLYARIYAIQSMKEGEDA
ncbi:MAG: ABC transporter ATP-binding protein [Clostridia bacterium]|nr:ABC transporter ATP-binding protein [Clostridia bacterium]